MNQFIPSTENVSETLGSFLEHVAQMGSVLEDDYYHTTFFHAAIVKGYLERTEDDRQFPGMRRFALSQGGRAKLAGQRIDSQDS